MPDDFSIRYRLPSGERVSIECQQGPMGSRHVWIRHESGALSHVLKMWFASVARSV